ncbi:MAG TPA: DsbA family protein, partial [Pseudogracilibacillus sp.]|nr:DsbA family protein [Pseudogracilibacillus sp.]
MKVDIWSDFVCPFCYIGKRRFEEALEKFPHKDNVEIEYKSYELAPSAAKHPGKNFHELLANKFGMSVEKAKATNEDIRRQAAEVGLVYNFDTMQHT